MRYRQRSPFAWGFWGTMGYTAARAAIFAATLLTILGMSQCLS